MEEITFDLNTVVQIVLYALALAGVFWTVKAGLNGLKSDVAEIKEILRTLVTSDADQNNRLTKVETEVSERKGWIRRIEETVTELARVVERRLAPRE